jgi:DNA-binding NtrC family response regulator
MTGMDTSVESAIFAERSGAEDYLLKPFKSGEVLFAVERAALRHSLRSPMLPPLTGDTQRFDNLVGETPRMREIYRAIQVVSHYDATVLITGETGTGKELVARAIHRLGPRRNKRFVTINCAAVPETLLETELFGHERGAFTGARTRKIGKFEYANEGTLFLDEVGDVPFSLQAKLLRVLEGHEFERVGGNETVRVDIRVIAATNTDLPEALAAGRFRKDLFYRLNVAQIDLPPLRERKEDIPLLVQHFLDQWGEKMAKPAMRLSPELMDALMDYDWPGNVRELENVLERAAIMSSDPVIRTIRFPGQGSAAQPAGSIKEAIVEYASRHLLEDARAEHERGFLEAALRKNAGNIGRTADAVGLSERTLHRKMKQYGLDKRDYRLGKKGPRKNQRPPLE